MIRTPASFRFLVLLVAVPIGWSIPTAAWAQRASAAGGVIVSSRGHAVLASERQAVPGLAGGDSPLVWVSLRRLQQRLNDLGTRPLAELPLEIRQLAGMERIGRVVIDRQEPDVWLGGVAAGKPVTADAFEHFLISLRHMESRGADPVSCSIDPTKEGLEAIERLMRRGRRGLHAAGLREALGPQTVTLEGVSSTSLAGRVMLAADLRFKSLAMNLDDRARPLVPSYLAMAPKSSGMTVPRWWLECAPVVIRRSADADVWEIGRASAVAFGELPSSPRAQATAVERWAECFTKRYGALRLHHREFYELERMANLWIAAAIVHEAQERLGCRLIRVEHWEPPVYPPVEWVEPKLGRVARGRDWVVGVSGGVRLDPRMIDRATVAPQLVLPDLPPCPDDWWYGVIAEPSASSGDARPTPRYFGIPVLSPRATFVLDRSDSMLERSGRHSRIELAKSELAKLLLTISDEIAVTVVPFDRSVTVWRAARLRSATARRDAVKYVSNVTTRPGTATFDAIATALAADPAPAAIYLLSDGQPTHGRLVDPSDIISAVRRLNVRQIPIHTVGLGARGTGAEFLRVLAETNGGTWVLR